MGKKRDEVGGAVEDRHLMLVKGIVLRTENPTTPIVTTLLLEAGRLARDGSPDQLSSWSQSYSSHRMDTLDIIAKRSWGICMSSRHNRRSRRIELDHILPPIQLNLAPLVQRVDHFHLDESRLSLGHRFRRQDALTILLDVRHLLGRLVQVIGDFERRQDSTISLRDSGVNDDHFGVASVDDAIKVGRVSCEGQNHVISSC